MNVFLAQATTEHGNYTHRYLRGFHRVEFRPNDGGKSEIVFSSGSYNSWCVDANKAITNHIAVKSVH